MGTKYSSISVSGYSASPPSDDGSTAASNQVKYSTLKTKLSDPLNTAIAAINSALVTALDQSVRVVTANDSAAATDHDKTIVIGSTVTAAVTVSLADAATMAAGYVVTVANQSNVACTVGRATASNTINGATSDYTLPAYHSITFVVASPATGYVIKDSNLGRQSNGGASLPAGTAAAPALSAAGDSNTGVFFPAADTVAVTTGGTERVRVDSSGNLGLGVTPNTSNVYKVLEIGGAGTIVGGTANGLYLLTGSNYDGGWTYKTTGSAVSRLDIGGGAFTWYTAASGTAGNAITWTTAATLNTSGFFKATGGQTTLYTDQHEFLASTNDFVATFTNKSGATPSVIQLYNVTDKNDATSLFIECYAGAATRARIRSNGGIANYQANDSNLSDRREKTDFQPAKSYLNVLCQIPVQTFKYIDQTDDERNLGVVAQDVQAVAPELVTESNWGKEDAPKMRLSIYQTDFQYALLKALQELKAEFDAYKAAHP